MHALCDNRPRPRRGMFDSKSVQKISFTFADAPADGDELANYALRTKALFSSVLRSPVSEWYQNNIRNTTIWENVR